MTDIRFNQTIAAASTLNDEDRRNAAITLAELADGDREGLALALAMLGLSRDVSHTAQGRRG